MDKQTQLTPRDLRLKLVKDLNCTGCHYYNEERHRAELCPHDETPNHHLLCVASETTEKDRYHIWVESNLKAHAYFRKH